MTRFSLRIQAVLYNESPDAIARSLESIRASAENWIGGEGEPPRIAIAYGDASPARLFDDAGIAQLQAAAGEAVQIEYRFFDENTGYGKGHNLLAQDARDDYLVLINPDIVFAPRCLERLAETARRDASIGAVEARQTPLENARWFDLQSGETDWAAGACLLVRRQAFYQAGGFDTDTFFMYCEDVDLSWAIRRAGFRVVCQPAAIAFHPHRLSERGAWEPNETERRNDALGKLLLARKWSANKVLRSLLAIFTWDDCPEHRQAVADFRAREKSGALPMPLANGAKAATWHGNDHTGYRKTTR